METAPVTKNEKITVTILPDATTPDYVKDAEHITGLLMWKQDLPADGKSEIKLGWRISWPQDSQITGLP
jgi:hypothetical protein